MQVLKYHRHFYNKCILTSRVLEIVVALVVEHLVGRQVHRRVQQLKRHRGLKGEIHKIVSFFVDVVPQRIYYRSRVIIVWSHKSKGTSKFLYMYTLGANICLRTEHFKWP